MKASFLLFLSLALFLSFASSSSFEDLERNVQGVVQVAENFVTKMISKNYHALIKTHTARHARLPQHQRQRHILIGKKHVDTRVDPSFQKNEHYEVLRRHSESDDLHEYYVNLKKVDWRAIQKIESDFGWEKTEKANGVKRGRLSSYIPHNTFVFVGTEEEALKLQDHELVYWVGARDPLHKLAGTFAKHPEDREKWTQMHKDLDALTENDLVVRLHFHSKITTQEQVDDIVKDIQSILDHNDITATVTSEKIGPEEFIVSVKCENDKDTHMAALRLAPLPAVHFLDQPPSFRTYNDLVNQWVETGEIDPDAMGGDEDDYVRDRSDSPLYFLDGETYLIGLADTGIDWDNCMFFDTSDNIQFDGATNDNNNRKIVNYDTTYGDQFDGVWHGTHMAGTLAGEEVRGSSSYPAPEGTFDGLVPEAKLVFADLSVGSSDQINIPAQISDLFDLTFRRDARVNVYGWGTRILSDDGLSYYNDLDFRTDDYAFDNPTFMGFFPTGNRQYERFPLAISTPASAKNIFAIASTRSFHEAVTRWYGRTGEENRDLYNFFHAQICSTSVFWWNDPAFCASFGFSSPCQQFQNTNICPNFQSVNDCCRFSYFQPLCCDSFFQENWNNTDVNSELLWNEYVLDGQGNHGPMFDERYGVDLVFPGTTVVSANSDQNTGSRNCGTNAGVKVLNGTSMSAAAAGGAAIKILQYFEQGYYPWGDSSRSDAITFSPSSILMKALLMSTTVSMTTINANQRQYYFDSHDMEVPNNYEGMGAPVLSRILHVYETPTDTNTLNVSPYGLRRIAVARSDDDPSHVYLNDDGFYRGCFRSSLDATHFTVTIAWNDPPTNRNSAFALVNNLDLVVMPLLGDAVYTGHSESGFDTRNNYEHVRFDASATAQKSYTSCPDDSPIVSDCIYQQYAIEVKGQPLVNSPEEIPFSIVVHAWYLDTAGDELPVEVLELGSTGQSFNGLSLECEADSGESGVGTLCPRNCSGYGVCEDTGFCSCYDGYTGLDCSLSVCEDDCSNNGVCDGQTGSCDCVDGYTGVNCAVFDPTVAANVTYVPSECNCGCDEDLLAVGAVAGIAIAAFIFGLLLGILLGAFIGIKWLIARKRRKVAELKQKLAARDNMAGGDAGVDPDGP